MCDDKKRPIDRVRDGAGSFNLKTADDESPITGMITLEKNLMVIKGKGIYKFKFADQIDPERKNIKTPNTIQKVLAYGSDEPWVATVVLTANNLLKAEVLDIRIDTEKAMLLIIELAQHICSAIEVTNNFTKSEKNALENFDPKPRQDRLFILPAIHDIEAISNVFIQKSDHAISTLFKLVKCFYPEINRGGWDSLKIKIENEGTAVDNFREILNQMLPFLQFVRNCRNCVEHPRIEQKIMVADFSINANNELILPTIEVIHPRTSQSAVSISKFMMNINQQLVLLVELMLVCLCNRNIRPVNGLPISVHEFPIESRQNKNVRYGYGIATKNGIIPFG